MTTIDRIMNKIYENWRSDLWEDRKMIRQILEAELTAFKGVDELIEKLKNVRKRKWDRWEDVAEIEWFYNELQEALNQTPVAKEDVGEMGEHIMLQPWEYYKDEFGNIITYEDEQKEMLKKSYPKEVTQSISREAVEKLRNQRQKEINNIWKYDIVEHEQWYYEWLVEGKQDEIKDLDQLLISNP